MASDILVVAAHPDDEVLGCGGTIARHAAEGDRVTVVILGEGVTARGGGRIEKRSEIEQLRTDAEKASALLGIHRVFFQDFPDNRFDSVALLDLVRSIESLIVTTTPDVVYTHHSGDLNIDHALTFRAVLTATRPVPDQRVRELYCFEVASASEWSFQRLGPSFSPNVFVDITGTIDAKIRAVEAYAGEVRMFPHPRSAEGVRLAARRWGSVVGVDHVEPFELVRAVRRA